jgi:hypothetical protein
MLHEQPPELASTDAKALRECLDAGIVVIERAITDKCKCA